MEKLTNVQKILIGAGVLVLALLVCGAMYVIGNNVLLPAVAKAAATQMEVSRAVEPPRTENSAEVGNPAQPEGAKETKVQVVEKKVQVAVGATGLTSEALNEYLSDTNDVGSLIAVLDRDWESQYELGHRGEWHAGGTVVECDGIVWCDTKTGKAPAGSEAIRAQGGWGIFHVPKGFVTPPETAGRWICLSGPATLPFPETVEAADADTKSKTETSGATVANCATGGQVGRIAEADDPVAAFDSFFEKEGYQYGASLEPGQEIPAGSFFLGTFEAESIPAGFTDLCSTKPGFLWGNKESATAPHGGRWMRACR